MTKTSVVFFGGPIRLISDRPDLATDPPESLLVENGGVTAAGTLSEMRREATATPRGVDLDGRTLFPGFVDAHTHTLLHGSGMDWVKLAGARSIEEIVDRMLSRATQKPGRAAVRGYGYDQSLLIDQRHPCATDLDRVSKHRVVQIQHASGHGYVVNSASLRRSGIDRDTPTPPGGRIDRDPTGAPTGLIFDSACDLLTGPDGVKVRNHGPNFHLTMPAPEVDRLFDLGQRSFVESGITTICDAQVTELEIAVYLRARDEGRLLVRAEMLALSSNLERLKALGLGSMLGDARLRFHGVKLYADGSVIARTAYSGSCLLREAQPARLPLPRAAGARTAHPCRSSAGAGHRNARAGIGADRDRSRCDRGGSRGSTSVTPRAPDRTLRVPERRADLPDGGPRSGAGPSADAGSFVRRFLARRVRRVRAGSTPMGSSRGAASRLSSPPTPR